MTPTKGEFEAYFGDIGLNEGCDGETRMNIITAGLAVGVQSEAEVTGLFAVFGQRDVLPAINLLFSAYFKKLYTEERSNAVWLRYLEDAGNTGELPALPFPPLAPFHPALDAVINGPLLRNTLRDIFERTPTFSPELQQAVYEHVDTCAKLQIELAKEDKERAKE